MTWTELLHIPDAWVTNPWVQALLIVLASLLIAKLADWVISHWIRRVTARTATDLDDRIIDLLHKPIFWSVVLLGLGVASLSLELHETISMGVLRILTSAGILLWAIVSSRILGLLLEVLSRFHDRFQMIEPGTLHLFDNLGKAVIWGGASYFALLNWSIDVTGWLASAGIAGLAVGFAAKDTIANLFAGVFILADKPYQIGDFVNLDSGERGQVTSIGLRTTRLLTRDDIEITLPNALIAQSKIVNESGGLSRQERLRLKVGVAYGTDIEKVERVLLDIAQRNVGVIKEPEPRVRFRAFGESSLEIELLCWIPEPVLRGRILHELNKAVYKAFEAEGIRIPFPQRDIHMIAASRPTTEEPR